MKITGIPEYLIVAAAGEFEPGLAVMLRFGMNKKKYFSYIAFIHKSPLTLTKTVLLDRFDRIRNLSLMDYADPREDFNGTVQVRTLTCAEIRKAIKHCRHHARSMALPAEHLRNLEAALRINPKSDCLVACEKVC